MKISGFLNAPVLSVAKNGESSLIAHNCILNEKIIWICPVYEYWGSRDYVVLECQKCGRTRRKIVDYEDDEE